MTRLIDADALMNTIIKKSYTVTDYWNTRDSGMFLFGIEQAINEQPIIDAEPVVRCKDCKHRPKGTGANHDLEFPDYVCPCQCEDDYYSWMPKDDWFCKDGERKEE